MWRAGCSPAVIMLTAATERRVPQLALKAGCLGYLSENADRHGLVGAILAASRHQTAFMRDVLTRLVHVGRVKPGADDDLTRRECEVLELPEYGKSPEEIATELHLSHHTVRNPLRHAATRLNARSKLDAVVKAMQRNLITVDQ